MSKAKIRFAALGVVVLLTGLTLTACGGAIPGNAVVNVNGTAITSGTFNHWMTVVESAAAGKTSAQAVVPDPPTFKACIAHLQATAPKSVKGQAKPTAATLKTQCEQQYTALKQQVLGFLISANWLIGEGSELGIKLSDNEVKKQFNQIKTQDYPKESDFQKFRVASRYTVSDLLLRVKLSMLESKIQQKVVKGAAEKPTAKEISAYYKQHKSQYGKPPRPLAQVQSTIQQQLTTQKQQQALSEFVKSFRSKWTGRTLCRSGYVVQNCKSYKAPKVGATTGAGTGTATPQTSGSQTSGSTTSGSTTSGSSGVNEK